MDKQSIDPISSFLAGISGGASSTILLYPLDLIKVRMQVDENNRRKAGSSSDGHRNNAPSFNQRAAKIIQQPSSENNTNPRTICTTVRGVIKHEGYSGLYRGLTPALIGSAASWGGFFIIYEELKMQLLQRKRQSAAALSQYQSNNTSLQSNNLQTASSNGEQYVISKDMHVNEEIDINTNTNNIIIQQTKEEKITLGPMEHFSASCLAGACMVLFTNPIWLIKTRLQLQNSKLHQQLSSPSASSTVVASSSLSSSSSSNQQLPKQQVKPPYRGLIHAAYTIVKEEGILALYKGSIPAMMLVSHGGIQFVAYEFLKGHFANFTNNNTNNSKQQWKKGERRGIGTPISERLRDSCGYLLMGAASKFIASTITYPIQVIKTRLQQRSQVVEFSEATGEIIVTKREYAGVVDCVSRIWRNEGIVGFFKGCVTNAIRVAPSAAITFVTYEFVLDELTEER